MLPQKGFASDDGLGAWAARLPAPSVKPARKNSDRNTLELAGFTKLNCGMEDRRITAIILSDARRVLRDSPG
jgi:hypothetical protein